MTPFKIYDIVRIRADEETKGNLEMLYGSYFAENYVGQVSCVLGFSEDKSEVELLWKNGEKRYLDQQFVESLSPSFQDKIKSLTNELRQMAFAEPEFNLHVYTIQNGDLNEVELLIANGAFLELEDSNGNRAVHCAVMKNLPGVLKLLISQGARLDCVNNKQQTPYHLAASDRFPDCLAVLMASPRSSFGVNSQDGEGNTALHLMAITKLGTKRTDKLKKFSCLFKKMLLRGVDFSLKNNQGLTVLQTAAEVGNLWALKHLLKFKGKSMMVEEMCEDCHSPNSPTSLYLACEAGHYEVAKCLLEFIVKNLHGQRSAQFHATFSMVKWAKRSLYIPLVSAIKGGHYAIVELLADSPMTDINARDRNGDSAMSVAEKIGSSDQLFDCNAPAISKIFNDMKTYLPTKAEPALAIILFLITKGAILNEEDSQNKIVINNLHEYLNVKLNSTNGLRHKSLSDLVALLEAQNSANTTDDVLKTSPTTQSTTQFQIIERYERRKVLVISLRDGLGHRYVEKKYTKIFQCQGYCRGKKRRCNVMVIMKKGKNGKAKFRLLDRTKRHKCISFKRAQRCLPQTENNVIY